MNKYRIIKTVWAESFQEASAKEDGTVLLVEIVPDDYDDLGE